ncbi:class I SAM-dependent methyltransferase [bacterium]|nr:class I SAM-dependent methyltransferase [bacterium]
MSLDKQSLAAPRFWENLWEQAPVRSLPFNPQRGAFGQIHARLQKYLPRDAEMSLLEVGCYPGRFMWYFNRYFGYRVEGIEYIGWCCDKTRELLISTGVEATVRQCDLLAWEPTEQERWDVVASIGFVEHFEDCTTVVARHAHLLKPGGFLVLEIPNHTGLYGKLLHWMAPAAWSVHNRMGLEQLEAAVRSVGGLEILTATSCGKFSLGHVGFLERSRRAGRPIHLAARVLKRALELLLRVVPEKLSLNSYFLVVARKTRD